MSTRTPTHGIFSSTGNLLGWVTSEDDTKSMLASIVADDPSLVGEVAAIPLDADGEPSGAATEAAAANVETSSV